MSSNNVQCILIEGTEDPTPLTLVSILEGLMPLGVFAVFHLFPIFSISGSNRV